MVKLVLQRFGARADNGLASAASVPDESGTVEAAFPIEVPSCTIMSVNIRCLLANLDELELFLKERMPHIVFLQETWLNASHDAIAISN